MCWGGGPRPCSASSRWMGTGARSATASRRSAGRAAGWSQSLALNVRTAALRELIAEHEGPGVVEADCARDADQLEMLLQARSYAKQGYTHMEPFVESALAALRTISGRRLAEAAMGVSPAAWWESFTRK